ncbi:MAG: hypothetical protein IKT41_05335 [Clostridia bacterium]|nr:hypothetical protein [Clostridia bacterium]
MVVANKEKPNLFLLTKENKKLSKNNDKIILINESKLYFKKVATVEIKKVTINIIINFDLLNVMLVSFINIKYV